MKPIRHTLGVLALACLTSTASAQMVEAVFDVTVDTRTDISNRSGTSVTVTDPDFQPVTFTASIRYDLSHTTSQEVTQSSAGQGYATTYFDPTGASVTSTPFGASLQTPAPAGASENGEPSASYSQFQVGLFNDADQVVPVTRQMQFVNTKGWLMQGLDGAGTTTVQTYAQGILLEDEGAPLSFNQFTKLSGQDALAFLRAQVGVLHQDAYSEMGWLLVIGPRPASGPRVNLSDSTEYTGDVVLRSVTVVPEPGTVALCAMGMAVVALRLRGKRQRGARLAA